MSSMLAENLHHKQPSITEKWNFEIPTSKNFQSEVPNHQPTLEGKYSRLPLKVVASTQAAPEEF